MPMDPQILQQAILSHLDLSNLTPEQREQVEALWLNIATEIINHIRTYGVVNVGIPVQVSLTTGTGATTGPGVIT